MTSLKKILHIKQNKQIHEAKRYTFAFVTLFGILLIIYSNSFQAEWHFDDFPNITENKNIQIEKLSWEGIQKTLYGTDANLGSINRPISYLSFGLNYYFGGKSVFGYHIVNFLIHYTTAIFLFLFITNTIKLPLLQNIYRERVFTIAFLSTLLWAIHPIHVSAVTYIVQRMASMAGMFYIMALYFYCKGRMCNHQKVKYVFFTLCGVASIFSFGSKENTVVLPATFLLYDLILIQGVTTENLKRNIKNIVLPIIVILIVTSFLVDFSAITGKYVYRTFTMEERLLTQPRVLIFYLSLLLYSIPSRLTLIHDFETSTYLLDPPSTMFSILFIVYILAVAMYISKKRPLIAFCIIFFFLNHIVESSFIPLEMVFEHRNYIPSMLFFLPVVLLLLSILKYFSYKKPLQLAFLSMFIFLGIGQAHTTYSRNEIFRSDALLWFDNVQKSPDLSRPHNNLGKAYWESGMRKKGAEEFKKAFELANYLDLQHIGSVYHNMGLYYNYLLHDYDEAISYYQESLAISGFSKVTSVELAKVFIIKGEFINGERLLLQVYNDWGENPEIHGLLALVMFKTERMENAVYEAELALEMKPKALQPLTVLSEVYKFRGEYEKAILLMERYRRGSSNSVLATMGLIELYVLGGEKDLLKKAVKKLRKLKGGEDLNSLIESFNKGDLFSAYIPNRRIIETAFAL